MTYEAIKEDVAIIYQNYLEDDVELHGEPAIVIRTYSDGTLGLHQSGKEVLLNSDTLPALSKIIKAFLQGKTFFEVNI